jgi:hypothetical protein
MLHQFYAVTLTSIYFVKDRRSKDDPCPFARKVALKGESSIPIGEELANGTMIAITKQLQAYIPEGGGMTSFQRRIEDVNTRYWGGNSSNIVALFTNRKKAAKCFLQDDLQSCDPRWIEETKKVIEKIGEGHPAFEVCKWHDLTLITS